MDFYGTLVHEDGEVIKKITEIIFETGKAKSRSEIAAFWWDDFQNMCIHSYGDHFQSQRILEKKSLKHTLEAFASTADVDELSNYLFEHWIKPPVFEDSTEFLKSSPIPIYIVSNIDTADVLKAIEYHHLTPAGVFTSEDAAAYKPRKEIFEYALKSTGLKADEVIHIGDSVGSDVKGAISANLKVLWLNRSGKEIPDGIESIDNLFDALSKIKAKNGHAVLC